MNDLSDIPQIHNAHLGTVTFSAPRPDDIILRGNRKIKTIRLINDGCLSRTADYFNKTGFSREEKMQYLYLLADALLNKDSEINKGYMQ